MTQKLVVVVVGRLEDDVCYSQNLAALIQVSTGGGLGHVPGQAKDRPPILKWLKPGSKWRAAVLIVADTDVVDWE